MNLLSPQSIIIQITHHPSPFFFFSYSIPTIVWWSYFRSTNLAIHQNHFVCTDSHSRVWWPRSAEAFSHQMIQSGTYLLCKQHSLNRWSTPDFLVRMINTGFGPCPMVLILTTSSRIFRILLSTTRSRTFVPISHVDLWCRPRCRNLNRLPPGLMFQFAITTN